MSVLSVREGEAVYRCYHKLLKDSNEVKCIYFYTLSFLLDQNLKL
jgi:hypothetical protein